jgi:hypothetical protein
LIREKYVGSDFAKFSALCKRIRNISAKEANTSKKNIAPKTVTEINSALFFFEWLDPDSIFMPLLPPYPDRDYLRCYPDASYHILDSALQSLSADRTNIKVPGSGQYDKK